MNKEKSFLKLKRVLLGELLEDYPEGAVYGKVEYFLKSRGYAVNILVNHGILERLSPQEKDMLISNKEERKLDWYRLTSKGVDLAISMINLENNNKIVRLTKWIIGLTIIMLIGLGIQIGLFLSNVS